MPKTYILGNWKMNQTQKDVNSFFDLIPTQDNNTYIGVAPQAMHITTAQKNQKNIKVGAQNCSQHLNGAYTGEIGIEAINDLGIDFVLVGHSERRQYFNETNANINLKIKALISNKTLPVLCIGESLEEFESNKTNDVILGQLNEGLAQINIASPNELVIAYEPVWAIGTGKTATPEQAENVHKTIRQYLIETYPDHGNDISILYGGSVKPSNVEELLRMENINGALVGGASLQPESFQKLCDATR